MGHSSSPSFDARSGYWNIKLDEESSYHTTFNTPYGRHRFMRLPFGLNCAQDVFQKKVDETFSDITGVYGISDDIIVIGYTSDGSDHDANLTAILERARATGSCFNDKKMVVLCKSIPFFGNIIGADGIEPDPERKRDRNMQHNSADGCQGITDIYWTGKLPWKVYPSPSFSVGASQRFVQDERSPRLGTRT